MALPYSGELAGLACSAIWAGTSFLWAAIGTRAGPVPIALLKALVGVVLWSAVVAIATGCPWPVGLGTASLGLLGASGLIGLAAGDACFFWALVSIGPRRALLLMLLAPPFAAILGIPTLGERIGAWGWIGIAATIGGIALVQLERTAADGARVLPPRTLWLGAGAGVLASLGQAIASLLTKDVLNRGATVPQALEVRLVAATLGLLLAGAAAGRLRGWVGPFAREPRLIGQGVLAACLGTGVGLGLMTYSQGAIPVGLSNALTALAPAFALPFAAVWRRERASARAWLGTCVAVAGAVAVCLDRAPVPPG